MTQAQAASWQITLADLSLILFLAALASMSGSSTEASLTGEVRPAAPDQAIFRTVGGTGELKAWLAEMPFDGRATLVLKIAHPANDFGWALREATAMQADASSSGYRTRLIMEESAERQISAQLRYDTAPTQSSD